MIEYSGDLRVSYAWSIASAASEASLTTKPLVFQISHAGENHLQSVVFYSPSQYEKGIASPFLLSVFFSLQHSFCRLVFVCYPTKYSGFSQVHSLCAHTSLFSSYATTIYAIPIDHRDPCFNFDCRMTLFTTLILTPSILSQPRLHFLDGRSLQYETDLGEKPNPAATIAVSNDSSVLIDFYDPGSCQPVTSFVGLMLHQYYKTMKEPIESRDLSNRRPDVITTDLVSR